MGYLRPAREVSQEWRKEALCRTSATSIWYPTDRKQWEARGDAYVARAICNICPVRLSCLDYALANETRGMRFGIYGGMTPNERDRLTRQRQTQRRKEINELWRRKHEQSKLIVSAYEASGGATAS